MVNGSGQVGWCRAEHRSGSGSHVLARMTPCTVVVQIFHFVSQFLLVVTVTAGGVELVTPFLSRKSMWVAFVGKTRAAHFGPPMIVVVE